MRPNSLVVVFDLAVTGHNTLVACPRDRGFDDVFILPDPDDTSMHDMLRDMLDLYFRLYRNVAPESMMILLQDGDGRATHNPKWRTIGKVSCALTYC